MRDGIASATPSLFVVALLFEGSLAGVGFLVAWAADVPLAELLWPPKVDVALVHGLLGALAMTPLLAAMLRMNWHPIASLRRLVSVIVRRLFGKVPIWQLALVALVAGLGEEILFRGAIQPLAVRFSSPVVGLVIASLLFGLAHAASWTYFWLATGVGLYLGAIALGTGEILSVIVVHALYDFVALTCLARGYLVRRRPSFQMRREK